MMITYINTEHSKAFQMFERVNTTKERCWESFLWRTTHMYEGYISLFEQMYLHTKYAISEVWKRIFFLWNKWL